jgi:hypothetical protein
MTNSILIGAKIYNLLMNNEHINEMVGTKIFPIVAENGTEFPFITYTKTNVQPTQMTKDWQHEDNVSIQINVASTSYSESALIAQYVREALESPKWHMDDMVIRYLQLAGIVEAYTDNTYIQTLSFTCKVQ